MVRNIITERDPTTTYFSVKAEVLRRNVRSSQNRFMTLMEDEQLSDRKLSEFLQRLRELIDSPSDDAVLLKKIFFARLPILSIGLEANSIDQMAAMADKILEFSSQPPSQRFSEITSVSS